MRITIDTWIGHGVLFFYFCVACFLSGGAAGLFFFWSGICVIFYFGAGFLRLRPAVRS
ncbi:hypothetical protein BJ912DRAFT_995397 [Pholiota molesta]|nr:hypothetical protein BJ912DRAFT_995397 [Pholiota molesta]